MCVFAFATLTIIKISNSLDPSFFNYEMTDQLTYIVAIRELL
jgi:hypothetical protein